MRHIIILFIIFGITSSCKSDPNKQIDEGYINENIYHSKEIGWTMEIPKGWVVTQKDVLENRTQKGMELISETIGEDYDLSGLKYLLSFQKNRRHVFQSTSEIFKQEYEGEWEENNQLLKEVLFETFSNQGIKVDTSSSKEIIDKYEFNIFQITVFDQNKNIILYQDMYSKLINDYDFGVVITYIDDKEKNEMLTAWKNSKFD